MKIRNIKYTFLVATAIFINSCAPQKPTKTVVKKPVTKTETSNPKIDNQPSTIKLNLPEVNREFRAAWIATVANINWPSKNTLSTQLIRSNL